MAYAESDNPRHTAVVLPPGGIVPRGRLSAGVVLFHGGSWQRGGPEQFEIYGQAISDAGMVVVACRYRLIGTDPGVNADSCREDARTAWRWVNRRAESLGIDRARLAAGGASAGGNLALSLATQAVPGDPKPAALWLLNPAFDLVHGGWQEGAELVSRASLDPLAFSPARQELGSLPPTWIAHGMADTTMPIDSVRAFRDRAAATGRLVELVEYAGRQHGFFNRDRDPTDVVDVSRRTIRFFESLAWCHPDSR
ncbi:MAG: alpha/beta hydrolase [Planctomycetota bacterium]